MYSRNTWEKRNGGYTVPPGYDGSRFRRSRSRNDEVILIPDSGFAPASDRSDGNDELSVSGIPTQKGIRNRRALSALAENADPPYISEDSYSEESAGESSSECTEAAERSQHTKGEKLSGILSALGFKGGMTSDDLLLCAVLFIIASDTDSDNRNVGDVLLILALLLGIR